MLFLETITNFYETHPKELRRFVKFALVGALGALIHFTLLNFLKGVWGWPLIWANIVAVTAAIISNFIWNRLWTFPESRSRKKRKQLPRFFLVNIIGLTINTLIVVVLDALLAPFIGEPWSYNIALAVAIGVVLIWNFGANRLWTYRGL